MSRHVILALLLVAGCGGPRFVPVSGQVLWHDKPLADARVIFQPVDAGTLNPGPGSYGRTDDNGRYTMRSQIGDDSGAVPGKHKVQIVLVSEENQQTDAGGVLHTTIPPRYNSRSELFITVPDTGTDKADFALHRD